MLVSVTALATPATAQANVFNFSDAMGYVLKNGEISKQMKEAIVFGETSEETAKQCRELPKEGIDHAIGGPACPSQPYTKADVRLAQYVATYEKGSPILTARIVVAVLAVIGGALYAAGPQLAALLPLQG